MSSDKEIQTEVPPKPPYPYPPRGKGKKPYKLTEDPQYQLKYYHRMRSAPLPCENCGKLVSKAKLYRHVQTPICARDTKDETEIEQIKEKHRQSLLTKVDAEI